MPTHKVFVRIKWQWQMKPKAYQYSWCRVATQNITFFLAKPSQCKQSWGQTFKSSLKYTKLDLSKTKQRNEEFKGQVNLSLLPSLFLKGQFSFVD